MKKFTLLLCLFVASVMMPQVMWADVTYPYVKGNLTINVVDGTLTINSRTTAGDLATFMSSNEGDDPTVIAAMKGCSSIVLIGKFNSSDLDAIKTNGEAFKVVSVDMSDALFPRQPQGNFILYDDGHLPQEDPYVIAVEGGDYYTREGNEENGFTWSAPQSYNDGVRVSYRYSSIEERPSVPTNDITNIVVGGKLYIGKHEYNPNRFYWVELDGNNDWTQMIFLYWKASIQTAVLPADVVANYLHDDLWKDCSNLSRIVSGETTAEINTDKDNNKLAYVTAATDEEFERMKAIVLKSNLIGNDANVKELFDGEITEVSSYAAHKVYHVVVKKAGDLRKHFDKNAIAQGSFLWFDGQCVLDSADLVSIADGNAYYYVDLYDVNTTQCPDIEKAITGAMKKMREDDLQYKGLILPKNPSTVGTTLIMDVEGSINPKPTCKEFIAYRNQSTTSAYIWNNETNNRLDYETLLTNMRDMLYAPAHETDVKNNTKIFSISSNSQHKIGYQIGSNVIEKKGNDVFDLLGDTRTIIETIDNELVKATSSSPEIFVLSKINGDFAAAVQATSIEKTPSIELIRLAGAISTVDVDSLNRFISGMRVLDLDSVPKQSIYGNNFNMLSTLKVPGDADNQNKVLEYVILPQGLDTTVVRGYANMPNLKTMISIGKDTLTAHLAQAGTLAEARRLAEKQSVAGEGLTTVTLRGLLNSNDISTTGNDNGLSKDAKTITTMDLEKAVFVNASGRVDCKQMNFHDAGFNGGLEDAVLSNLKLPTDARMDTIPEGCLYNLKALKEICVPFNYQVILDDAFNESNLEHLTTTDAQNGVLIDKGPKTYTFSKNLKQLGTTPYIIVNGERVDSLMEGLNSPRGVQSSPFPKETGVKDIYVLATKVPKCYKNVFAFNLTFGYGGQDESKVYCRDRYFNNGDTEKSFSLLRYPSEDVFNRRVATGQVHEDSYGKMQYLYTDTSKVYTKLDQTGAVDANGNTLLWPVRTEATRTYYQASVGALWNDWMISYYGDGTEINDSEEGIVSQNNAQEDNNNNNSGARRFDPAPADTLVITPDYTGTTSGVTVTTVAGKGIKFKPNADFQNMFQYKNLAVNHGRSDSKKWSKLVVEFAEPAPEGYFLHSYGTQQVIDANSYSVANRTKWTLNLKDQAIDDFTLFNAWDVRDSIIVSKIYFCEPVETFGEVQEQNYPRRDLIPYLGWHQIVLTQSTYTEKVDSVSNNKIIRDYEDAGWYTLCIPFDLTRSEVLKMMGVPASVDSLENYVVNGENRELVSEDRMPDIRQLKQVVRKKGDKNTDNQINFILTKDLYEYNSANSKETYYFDLTETRDVMRSTMEHVSAKQAKDKTGDPRCIVGGRPYIIKVYKRKGETISKQNLGMYILKRYADLIRDSASCVNSTEDYYEQLAAEGATGAQAELLTLRFAKPYEKHKVQAVDDSRDGAQLVYTDDNNVTHRFYYTMIGQFWQQALPENCIYMSKGTWYHYSGGKAWTWDPYKCIIMATPEVEYNNGHDGGGFRNNALCSYPTPESGTTDLLKENFWIKFLDGRDDHDFTHDAPAPANATRYVVVMDDEVIEFDADGNETTAIKMLDGVPQATSAADTRVYNLSGQYMGKTTEGLPKGLYIVGGRKIVVE